MSRDDAVEAAVGEFRRRCERIQDGWVLVFAKKVQGRVDDFQCLDRTTHTDELARLMREPPRRR